MEKQRRTRTPQEKFRIVIEGIRNDYGSISALCKFYGITQTDFYRWRDIFLRDGAKLFERGGIDKIRDRLERRNQRYRREVNALKTQRKEPPTKVFNRRRLREESAENKSILERIRVLREAHPFWGYKRLSVWLRKREKLVVNHKRIYRLMKNHGLLLPRKIKSWIVKRKALPTNPKPKTTRPNRFWGIDMTKILLPQTGWAYLHVVIDWGNKKLLSAYLSRHSRSRDWIEALERAVDSEFPQRKSEAHRVAIGPELISDHGTQPTSNAFQDTCSRLGIHQIFTSYGNPRGNADTERMTGR